MPLAIVLAVEKSQGPRYWASILQDLLFISQSMPEPHYAFSVKETHQHKQTAHQPFDYRLSLLYKQCGHSFIYQVIYYI